MLFFGTLLLIFFFAGIRIVYEYKRALKFRFGKYVKTLQPGFRWIIPIVETIQKVDEATEIAKASPVPDEELIYKDVWADGGYEWRN